MKRLFGMIIVCFSLLAGCSNTVPLMTLVNQAQNGDSIALQQGQELIVELETNKSSAWQLVLSTQDILSEPEKRETQDQEKKYQRYVFTALYRGDSVLRFEEQPVLGGAGGATQVFTLQVRVE